MSRRPTTGWIPGLALVTILGVTRTGTGAIVTQALNDPDASSANAKYEITFDNSKFVSINYSPVDVGNQHGTLAINAIWGAGMFDTRSITFTQTVAPGGGFSESQGLRLQLEFGIGNQSGTPWLTFLISTMDDTVPAGIVEDETFHKLKAHFHPNSGGTIISGTGFNTTDAFNNQQSVTVSGGQLNSGVGEGFLMSGLFLHERNLRDANGMAVKRAFTLNLRPGAVPEPSSLAMASLGAAVGLGCWFRARFRRRPLIRRSISDWR